MAQTRVFPVTEEKTLPHAPQAAQEIATAEAFTEVQQLYGRHMRAMDDGEVAVWTSDFTEDAVFATNARPEPQRGRAEIARNATTAARRLEEEGVLRRHCVTTLDLRVAPDGTLVARTYALITRTVVGETSVLEFVCTCQDTLVRREGRLLITHRQVRRDDLQAA